MHDSRVARRYASALFNTALPHDLVGAVEVDLNTIVRLFGSDPDFHEFLGSPRQSRDEKMAIVERVFSDRITGLTMQLLRVMLAKRREAELPFLRDEYVRLRREHEGVVFASVVSAEALKDSERWALMGKLQAQLGKRIEAEFSVDPALIGGVTVAFYNEVLDGSVRGALERLRDTLRYDLLRQA